MARPKKVMEPPTAEQEHGATIGADGVTHLCDCGAAFFVGTQDRSRERWEQHVKMARLQRSALRRNLVTR